MNRPFTDEEKSKIVSSVYSNPKKLKIATCIYIMGEATATDISNKSIVPKNKATEYLKEMLENGIVTTRRESYYVFYSLTELGKKLVMFFE